MCFLTGSTRCPISDRKYILQITQPSQYKHTKLQYRFAVISDAPSNINQVYIFGLERIYSGFAGYPAEPVKWREYVRM